MAKLSQGFYLTFFSTASLLWYKKKPLWGRQQIDHAGADVFTQQLVTHPQRSFFIVGHFRLKKDWNFMTQTARGELALCKRGKWTHISPVCHPTAWGLKPIGLTSELMSQSNSLPIRADCGPDFPVGCEVQIATYLDRLCVGVLVEICGSAKKIQQNKTFLSMSVSGGALLSHLSSPTLQFPC